MLQALNLEASSPVAVPSEREVSQEKPEAPFAGLLARMARSAAQASGTTITQTALKGATKRAPGGSRTDLPAPATTEPSKPQAATNAAQPQIHSSTEKAEDHQETPPQGTEKPADSAGEAQGKEAVQRKAAAEETPSSDGATQDPGTAPADGKASQPPEATAQAQATAPSPPADPGKATLAGSPQPAAAVQDTAPATVPAAEDVPAAGALPMAASTQTAADTAQAQGLPQTAVTPLQAAPTQAQVQTSAESIEAPQGAAQTQAQDPLPVGQAGPAPSAQTQAATGNPKGNTTNATQTSGPVAAPSSPRQAAPSAGALTLPEAQQNLQQTVPEAKLHFQASETAPATAKPALTELLALPKADIQTPRLFAENRALDALAPAAGEAEPVQNPAPKAEAQAAPQSAEAAKDAVQAVAARTDAGTNGHASLLSSNTFTGAEQAVALGGQATATLTGTRAASPTQASLQWTAKSDPVFAQVDGSVRWILKNAAQGAELQLHPDSLGRLVINLRVEGGEVHAKLWASEATAIPVLQEHRAALELSLREQGLSLGSFDLQQGNRGNDAQSSQETPTRASSAQISQALGTQQEVPSLLSPVSINAYQIEGYA